MRIGIDISQAAYEGTGVGEYVTRLVENLVKIDQQNEYILFFSGLRRKIQNSKIEIQNDNAKVKIKKFRIPPIVLDLLWNKLHVVRIEWFIGDVDVFISSDWTQPPTKKAKKATILYDLIVYKHPQETAKKIVETQKRRLKWIKQCDAVFCISEATKRDAQEILGLDKNKLFVMYPGVAL